MASEALKQRCMRAKGFKYTPEEPLPPMGPIGNELRYGSADSKIAASYGYGLTPERDPEKQKQPVSPNADMPADAFKALTGFSPKERVDPRKASAPNRGCVSEAEQRLSEGAPDMGDPMLAQHLSQESFVRSMDDPRVKKVFRSWSACMKKKGFDYQSPMDPAKTFTSGGPAGNAEKSTATADVSCKQETNVVGIWYAVEKAYQLGSVKKNFEQLEMLRKSNETVLEAASKV
ncbi:hypothetical protein [Streptomyces enissocaesilis]|uniref:Uncharacterized protein n=1 Tax=Streptomyces enissocaesilis TaxID=332589 RepID=A0ABP6J649_9ACTN